jgi:hypothetical protein
LEAKEENPLHTDRHLLDDSIDLAEPFQPGDLIVYRVFFFDRCGLKDSAFLVFILLSFPSPL